MAKGQQSGARGIGESRTSGQGCFDLPHAPSASYHEGLGSKIPHRFCQNHAHAIHASPYFFTLNMLNSAKHP